MGRTWSGVALLLAALLVLLVVPRVLSPGVTGTAARAPAPSPPPIGSCVLWPAYETIDCALPHTAEVVAHWEAEDPEKPNVAQGDNCTEAAAIATGMRPADLASYWGLTTDYPVNTDGQQTLTSTPLTSPARERIGGMGWVACVTSPVNPPATYVGSLKDQPIAPPAGMCYFEPIEETTTGPVPCHQGHRVELLSSVWLTLDDGSTPPSSPRFVTTFPTREQLTQDCRAIAEHLLATPDPTFGGRVEISLTYDIVPAATFEDGSVVDQPMPESLSAQCSLHIADGALLTGTLLGIGDKPLPVQ